MLELPEDGTDEFSVDWEETQVLAMDVARLLQSEKDSLLELAWLLGQDCPETEIAKRLGVCRKTLWRWRRLLRERLEPLREDWGTAEF